MPASCALVARIDQAATEIHLASVSILALRVVGVQPLCSVGFIKLVGPSVIQGETNRATGDSI
jgi:hypothetical protein